MREDRHTAGPPVRVLALLFPALSRFPHRSGGKSAARTTRAHRGAVPGEIPGAGAAVFRGSAAAAA
ncbi:hypothetical protein GCM10027168_32060 [Streptomyces capparidis]